MSNEKFRPYLTAKELTLILGALKSQSVPAIKLIRYLETFAIKIERGVISSALTLEPTMEEKLGLTSGDGPQAGLDPHILYTAWLANPAGRASLSPKQIQIIREHRYLNDLMTPEEESEYELSLMQVN